MADSTTQTQDPNGQSTLTTAAATSEILKDAVTIADNVAALTAEAASVSWWTALCGFLTALPQMIMLFRQLITWWQNVDGTSAGDRISKLGQDLQALNAAKTLQDSQNADKSIAGDIHNLP